MPQLVLYQPQIPPNTGNVGRTCAATSTELHLIGPLGFSLDDRQLKRAGLDYWPWVALQVHASIGSFEQQRGARGGRLVALTSHGDRPYTGFRFAADDWLLLGRETDGLPPEVMDLADARLTIPMAGSVRSGGGVRSLNLSVAAAVVLFEALRQLETGF
ncbi:tRNA (cytidine(34)-2'-O)-methyltransferase [Synechococcus sp. Tobar12-5m-g]|jgi:tRNA (cytidine/uridine-2'-O-)-methyltransferase|uniref:tRNA (cytidine(34)-2'-O)-methyltransferase n=1 Tax=unclassified Synechococcus TaxID=2626047 RepID=UPI0020CF0AF8|nr:MULTISPECIES: tRNA (cytidine(34)-2'-O)-methyltransferase [unclassified Synechococcus]MCP9773528.1 tRNA (cytidine(34)-2'-O)-methyltransferase [Synechococcus sp. Tobar12-5m-g]MCP9874487.1 tRNA (cytidine(34)-2'-O)-methyltransferase [Synechococcus sp. Cruz CV-v-12]